MNKKYNLNTGSPKPKAPMSKPGGPTGGKGPSYNPAKAAKSLNQPAPKC